MRPWPWPARFLGTGVPSGCWRIGKGVPGGIVASLSIPWGFTHGDDDIGGYHLVWPRDLDEAAGAMLAPREREDVRRILGCLERTQAEDGLWPQKLWMDRKPYWTGIKLDETAFPILLVNLARREKVLQNGQLKRLWPVVRRAAMFLVLNGSDTEQDRFALRRLAVQPQMPHHALRQKVARESAYRGHDPLDP
jgi:glucoamylase